MKKFVINKITRMTWAWILAAILITVSALPLGIKVFAGTNDTVSYEHNFTTDEKSDSFFHFTGNLSIGKGQVAYNGKTLTTALKMESATNITFSAPSAGKLTLVFSESSASVKINGTKYTASNKIITADITSGNVTVTKSSVCNLYYILFSTTSGESSTSTQVTTQAPTQEPTTQAPTTSNPNVSYATGLVSSISKLNDSQFKTVIYCSPNGTAANAGTSTSPKDLKSALDLSATTNGIVIILKGGTYSFSTQLTIPYGNNGTASSYKVLKAAQGENVILDFSSQPYGDTATNARGLQLEGDYWYVYGITVTGAADNGIFVAGSHNVIERCILKANRDSGLQISRRNSSISDKSQWPSYNYIINCTSYDNMDPATNENADGFAAKLTCGEGNVFDGCISYSNIDDGWDLYAKSETGSIGVVTIRNCISFNNGTLTNGTSSNAGDRNGFKLGGSNGAVPTPHVVLNCLSFNNGKDGFTDNGNGAALSLKNCTSANNAKIDYNFGRTSGGIFSGLLSVNANSSDKFIGTLENSVYFTSSKYYKVTAKTAIDKSSKAGTAITAPSSSDFVSTNVPAANANTDTQLRNADGTIKNNGYLVPKSSGGFSGMGASFGGSVDTLNVNVSLK